METLTQGPPVGEVKRLLAACGLPVADLGAGHMAHFFAARQGGALAGVVGLEVFGDCALLRSLAVAEKRRGRGLGRRLVARAEAHARSQGVGTLYLLTATAEPFFSRLGYRRLAREAAPAPVRFHPEFTALCPAGAAFMAKDLAGSD